MEDEPALLDLIEEYIIDYIGHEVVKADDGIVGFEAFSSSPDSFDLLITDIKLPRLDGIGLVKRIREVSAIPVIITTGHADLKQNALMSGIDIAGVLTKPFRLNELDSIVARTFNQNAHSYNTKKRVLEV